MSSVRSRTALFQTPGLLTKDGDTTVVWINDASGTELVWFEVKAKQASIAQERRVAHLSAAGVPPDKVEDLRPAAKWFAPSQVLCRKSKLAWS